MSHDPANVRAIHESPHRNRRSIRLQGYDYSRAGAYFVTICTQHRECLFGEIVNGEMWLNNAGRIVVDEWLKTAEIRAEIELDEWVVMPNHFHGILVIADGRGTACRAQNDDGATMDTARRAPNDDGTTMGTARRAPNDDGATMDTARRAPNDDGATMGTARRAPNDDGATMGTARRAPNDDGTTMDTARRAPNDDGTTMGTARRAPNDDGATMGTARRAPNDDGATMGTARRAPNDDGTTMDTARRAPNDDGATMGTARRAQNDDGATMDTARRAPNDDGTTMGTARRAPTVERFGQPVAGSIPTIIRSFKSAVTKHINESRQTPGTKLWQRNYWEHIVRNETELNRIREYIQNNPAQWEMDKLHPSSLYGRFMNRPNEIREPIANYGAEAWMV